MNNLALTKIRDIKKMSLINLEQKFAQINQYWDPKIVATLNGQEVRIAKVKGEFVWHHHEHEDELFLVHKGRLILEFRDHSEELLAGDMYVVPKGIEHRPVAPEEVELVLFEPASTLNTGQVENEYTRRDIKKI